MTTRNTCQSEYYHVGAIVDGRYRLTEFIGVGGMACVYRAQEEGSPHQYAFKFLKAEYHNLDYLIDYFRDEASSMRDLAHPNIVRFYRFVNQAKYSYIIMDYVNGFSLSDVIKRMYKREAEIPLDEVLRVMVQVARAIDAIHREGYVHRDIKPSNVLIERTTGQTFLTDLGITAISNTRMEGAGTVAYMPPEMMDTWIADHRADIYSFGIMFFEMLAKTRPFRVSEGLRGAAAEEDLKHKHKQEPVPDITEYRPDLPDTLNQIMAKALAKDPKARYDSILEFTQDVHNVLQPYLSDDMQDFSTITYRQIIEPEQFTGQMNSITGSYAVAEDNRLFYGMLAVGIVAIVLATLLAVSAFFGNTTPEPTEVASIAETEEAIVTSTPFLTPTANPVESQPVYQLITGVDALAELAVEALVIPPAPDSPLQYLRVGRVDGFRLEMNISATDDVDRYGAAFRVQDNNNYLAFTFDPQTRQWQFIEVVDGITTVGNSGTYDDESVDIIAITGRENYFEAALGDTVVSFISEQFPTGSLALYIEGDASARLTLDALAINLIGDDALAAVENPPTPSAGIADPLRFLKADVRAMLATNDVINSAINCPDYIAIYNTLDTYLNSPNDLVREFAQETLDAGLLVFTRCRSESPDSSLAFFDAFSDYVEWEEALRAIQQDLDTTG